MENLQRPVHDHLQVDAALQAPPAQLLAVNPRIHKQNAILQIYLQKVPAAFGRHPEQARHQLRQLQPQVLGDAAHEGAVFGLLGDRVVDLASPCLPGCDKQKDIGSSGPGPNSHFSSTMVPLGDHLLQCFAFPLPGDRVARCSRILPGVLEPGGTLGLKAMRSALGGPSPEHTLCRLCCEYDQLPTALEHTSGGRPGPHAPSGRGAEHRSAAYSSSVSTNRLDTAQMPMIRYTLTSSSAACVLPAPADARDEALGAWPLSTSDSSTVAVAVSAGSPWSFTSTSRRWRGASASSRARVVLTSPVYSPTRNALRAPPTVAAACSSNDSHAL
ncbi:hypothetical protein MC885_008424 [Smutsia gigantea]|nr:hypothetical protein MC885_008424 [Smutsia gigantea]